MKFIICLSVLISSFYLHATPVMEQGVGTVTPYAITIVPDDKDKTLFYFFPNHYALAALGDRKAFSCMETTLASRASVVECNMIFEASVAPDTSKKIQEVKTANPQAKFSPIPYTKMNVLVGKNAYPFLSASDCQKDGSETGQQITCSWRVNPAKFKAFRRLLLDNALVEVMEYSTQFIAVANGASIVTPFTIPIYVSDLGKGDYFFDNDGSVLK